MKGLLERENTESKKSEVEEETRERWMMRGI